MISETGEQDFYSGVLDRIQWIMVVLGTATVITALIYWSWRVALGLMVGATVAYLNFYWLRGAVARLAAQAAQAIQANPRSVSRGIVRRFLLRYLLMAFAAFAILTVSRDSLYGFFAGLFLPVTAMLCEAAYQAYKVLSGR
jgi:ATP synthase I chain